MYRNMLIQERQHFEKIMRIAYEQSDKFNGVLTKQSDHLNKSNGSKQNGDKIPSNILQPLDINSCQRICDSFLNDSEASVPI